MPDSAARTPPKKTAASISQFSRVLVDIYLTLVTLRSLFA